MSNRSARTITRAVVPACIDHPGLTVWIADGIRMLPARLKSHTGAVGDVGGARRKPMPKNSAVAKFSGKPSLLGPADESAVARAALIG
jgi:hypothetical protein